MSIVIGSNVFMFVNIIVCVINIIMFIIILLGVPDTEPISLGSCVKTQFCWVLLQDPFRLGPVSRFKSLEKS